MTSKAKNIKIGLTPDDKEKYKEYFEQFEYDIDDIAHYIAQKTENSGTFYKEIDKLKEIVEKRKLFAEQVLTELYIQRREATVIDGQLLYNTKQAAALLGVEPRTVLKYIQEGKLKAHPDSSKIKLVKKEFLRQFANKITSFLANTPEDQPFSITLIDQNEEEVTIDTLYITAASTRDCYDKINKLSFKKKINKITSSKDE